MLDESVWLDAHEKILGNIDIRRFWGMIPQPGFCLYCISRQNAFCSMY